MSFWKSTIKVIPNKNFKDNDIPSLNLENINRYDIETIEKIDMRYNFGTNEAHTERPIYRRSNL